MDRSPQPSPGSASLISLDRTCPELKTADWDRKRGTYSYHRFDDRIHGPTSVGGAAIGKVQVDLKWNFRQSQWGCIDGDKPAGILYLDIGLHQQVDYRLVSIVVEVTLEDISPEDGGGDPDEDVPVQMTDWFGPKQILGREHVQHVTKDSKFQPSFEGFGFGIGGVGKSSQSETLVRSRWEFAGRLKRPDRTKTRAVGGTHYKTLQWTVSENELESARNNTIHVAFTFEHGGQPFHMHAKVEGTLRSKRDRFMNGLRDLKFGPRHDRSGDVSTTYVGTYTGYRMPLDELAKGLDLAMQERNWRSRPAEIPEPQQATFGEIQPPLNASPSTGSATVEQGQEADGSAQQAGPGVPIAAHKRLPRPDPFLYLVSTPESERRDTLERLGMAGERFAAPSTAEKGPQGRLDIPSMSVAPDSSATASQPPSEVSSLVRPSAASVISKVSSATTLVDHAEQTATLRRLPSVPKRPSSPPVSRPDVVPPKQARAAVGILRIGFVAIIRLYLFFLVGIPLRCLRAGIAIVAAAVRLVGGVEKRASQALAKHAPI
ncbi:hypothetical protein RB595_008942 [Gaeumannomyces hyphopodioides]